MVTPAHASRTKRHVEKAKIKRGKDLRSGPKPKNLPGFAQNGRARTRLEHVGGLRSISVKFEKRTEFLAYRGRKFLRVERGPVGKRDVVIEISNGGWVEIVRPGKSTVRAKLTGAEVKRIHRFYRQVLDQQAEGLADRTVQQDIDNLPRDLEAVIHTRFATQLGRPPTKRYLQSQGDRVVLSGSPD